MSSGNSQTDFITTQRNPPGPEGFIMPRAEPRHESTRCPECKELGDYTGRREAALTEYSQYECTDCGVKWERRR